MTSKTIYTSEKALPYVYRITNKKTKEFYIGYRYKNVDLGLTAIKDIGIIYWTSGKIKKSFKNNPKNFIIEILFESNHVIKNPKNNEDELIAYWYEQIIIRDNIKSKLCLNGFYINPENYSKMWKSGSNVNKGKVIIIDSLGNKFSVSINDPRIISGELIVLSKGRKHSDKSKKQMSLSQLGRTHTIETKKQMSINSPKKFPVKDSRGNVYHVNKKEFYQNNDLVGINAGKILSETTKQKISNQNKGFVVVKDCLGNIFKVSVDDPRIASGELVGHTKGKASMVDINTGICFQVSVDDPRIASGELVGPNKGKGHRHKSKRTKEHTEKLREARIGIPLQKTTCPYCNFTGGGGNMKRYHFNNCKQLLSKN